MLLQKIKEQDGKIHTCIVANYLDDGNSRTLCGDIISDMACEGDTNDDGYFLLGNFYEGKLRQVTCKKCLQTVKFCKSLK